LTQIRLSDVRLSDDELLKGLWNESAHSFKEIYDYYWSKLYWVAYRKIGEKEIAEELVQEIFLNLWLKRKTIVIKSSLEAYLFTAVKYSIINHYQAQLVRNKYHLAPEHAFSSSNFTEEEVLTEELYAAFRKALAALSTKTRLVFEKSRLQHLTNKEIANELQLTDKAVEFHITKTIKHLKVYLKDFVIPCFIFFFIFFSLR
jgi:RNA polymerase sigma-70 factor (ECF subfamily)